MHEAKAHDPGKVAGTLPVPWEGTGIAPYAGQAPRTVLLMQTEGCTLHNMLRNYGMACYTLLVWHLTVGMTGYYCLERRLGRTDLVR